MVMVVMNHVNVFREHAISMQLMSIKVVLVILDFNHQCVYN